MKLKTHLNKDQKHTDLVSAVSFSNPEEVFSCADDHHIIRWNINTDETAKVTKLPDGVYPTDMHWFPSLGSGGGTKKVSGSDVFALASTDGKIYIVSKSGRIEKTIDAHSGAALCVRWSPDGTMLVSAGEDGAVKIWSKSGMLRSTLSQNSFPVYSVSWSATSDSVIYCIGKKMVLKSLQANAKPTVWKGHDKLILKVDWNPVNNLIISCGEDCRYKVWDSFGRCIFTSQMASDYPITSIAWAPDGEIFAVGSFNTIRLCDKSGWSHSLDKIETGSIMNIAWSNDSTQLVGAGGNGKVMFGHVIGQIYEWAHIEATIIAEKSIGIVNVLDDSTERLEFRDRIVKVKLDWNHLVVCTASQCFVYGTRNWNTPIIFDLKGGSVTFIAMCEKQFLLVDEGSVHIYSYEGRLICSPRFQDMKTDILSTFTCSLCNDSVAMRDKGDEKAIHVFDTQSGKLVGDGKPIMHKMEVVEIALDQCGSVHERKIAVIDKNRDLYLIQVRTYGTQRKCSKIGTMIESMSWNAQCNMLSCIGSGRLMVYFYPASAFLDRNLLRKTIFEKDASEFGKSPQISKFDGRTIIIRKSDGSHVSTSVSPHPGLLHALSSSGKWKEALKLCHFANDDMLWSVLAAMATANRDLDTAEIAFAAISEPDKVSYIRYIKSIPIKEARNAEMLLLSGNVQDAEGALLQAGLVFRAIMLNLNLYNWDRALDLATKQKTCLDVVVGYRRRYMEKMERKEINEKFIQLQDSYSMSWEDVQAKVASEIQNEKEKPVTGTTGSKRTAAR